MHLATPPARKAGKCTHFVRHFVICNNVRKEHWPPGRPLSEVRLRGTEALRCEWLACPIFAGTITSWSWLHVPWLLVAGDCVRPGALTNALCPSLYLSYQCPFQLPCLAFLSCDPKHKCWSQEFCQQRLGNWVLKKAEGEISHAHQDPRTI